MKMKSILFLLGFVLCSITVTAQVQFDAKVSKKKLGINERLRIDFEMNQMAIILDRQVLMVFA